MINMWKAQKRRTRIRNLVIRITLVIVFAGIVLLVVENLVVPAMTNQRVSIEYGEYELSNVGLTFVLSEEFEVPFDLLVTQSLRQQYGESAVKLTLNGVALSGEKLGSTAKQICLTNLWITEPLPIPENSSYTERQVNLISILNQIPVESTHNLAFDDFCVQRNKIKFRASEADTVFIGVMPFATGKSSYFYPFDTRSINLEIWVETEIEYEDNTKVVFITAPNIQNSQNIFLDWQMHLFKEQVTPEYREHPVTRYQLTMERPFSIRLLTTTLLLSLFIIIFLLSFTRQIDAFIQASVAVLLTLLGIQDLLTPATKTQTTIVDQAILGLYILFALVVLSHLTVKPIWERTRVSEEEAEEEAEEIAEEDGLNEPQMDLSMPHPNSLQDPTEPSEVDERE